MDSALRGILDEAAADMSSRLPERPKTPCTVRSIPPMFDRRLPHGARVIALLALLLAFLLPAGCGESDSSSSTGGGPDPATVASPTAAFYGEATVRPSGDVKSGVVAAARKILRVQDPGAELRRLLDENSRGIDFGRDVEPWLGQRVGGFVLMPHSGSGDPDWALALSIADRGAFDDALPRLRREQHEGGSYRGIAYDKNDAEDTYGAPVGDFYVAGTLAGLRAAIDASKGSSLAEASRFKDAIGAVPDDALALVYVDPKALVAAAGDLPEVPPASRRAFARLAQGGPVVASLTATADEIAIEGSGQSPLGDTSSGDAEVSVGALPGDAWLALATPPLGPIVRDVLVGAGIHDQAAVQVQAKLGLDLDRDLLAPLGGLGLFARGASPLDLGGGALLQLTDAAAAQRLLTRIQTIVAAGTGLRCSRCPQAAPAASRCRSAIPQPIVVLAKSDRLAAGYAASSAEDLLDPQQRFDESSAGKAAIDTLGDGYEPSLVLIVPPIAGLLRTLDQLEVADFSSVIPYVNAYRSLAVGTKRDGDRTAVRIVAALR